MNGELSTELSIGQTRVQSIGVGKSGVTKGTGFGGQLTTQLTKQLSGSMREEINNGTSIFFVFKIDKAARYGKPTI